MQSSAQKLLVEMTFAMVQVEGANATDGRGPSIWNAVESLPGHTSEIIASTFGNPIRIIELIFMQHWKTHA